MFIAIVVGHCISTYGLCVFKLFAVHSSEMSRFMLILPMYSSALATVLGIIVVVHNAIPIFLTPGAHELPGGGSWAPGNTCTAYLG